MKCNLFLKDMRWNLFLLLLKICIYCVARKELLGLAEQLLDTICKCALSLRYKAVAQQLRPSRCQSEQWNFSWQVRSTTMTFSLPVNYFIYSKRVLAGELLGWHSPWRNWESLSLAHKTWYSACDVSGPVGKGGLFLPFWLLFWGADIYPWLLPVPHTPQSRCIWTHRHLEHPHALERDAHGLLLPGHTAASWFSIYTLGAPTSGAPSHVMYWSYESTFHPPSLNVSKTQGTARFWQRGNVGSYTKPHMTSFSC